MNYKNNKKQNKINEIDIIKRFFQWSHYQGGLPLVFIMFGLVLIGIFAIFSYWFGYKWVVLVLGLASISIGIFLDIKDCNKNNK